MINGLDPCPLCGGVARIESFVPAPHGDIVTIKCSACGLTLDWTTDYYYSKNSRVHTNLTATQAWNRRAKQVVANQEPRWIPVTERLPEKHGCTCACLLKFPRSEGAFPYMLNWYEYGDNGYVNGPHFSDEGLDGMKVTHWMPLPKPPKEG